MGKARRKSANAIDSRSRFAVVVQATKSSAPRVARQRECVM